MEIIKGTLIIVCYGSYQPNLDYNIKEVTWGIHCTDTEIYEWGYLLTTSQVVNSHISELTGIYPILALL